jgi:hypothetical protein
MMTRVGRGVVGVLSLPARLLERTRGRKRLALVALYLLIGTVIGVFAWRESTLRGLPDVGDPFDVAAFQAERAAEADDAYPLYQRAFGRLKPLPRNLGIESMAATAALEAGRPPDRPEYRRWSRANSQALELWRRATEKPDVNWPSASNWRWMATIPLQEFSWLADEQAHLAWNRGDRAEAWKWRLAILRSYRHFTRRGHYFTRSISTIATHGVAGQILPRLALVDDQLLRRMLADLKAVDAMTPPNSETIKAEYLNALEELSRTTPRPPPLDGASEFQWYKHNPGYLQARKFFQHEPERSRRLLKIVAANQLVYADRPSLDRLPIVPPGMFDVTFDPSAPREARHLDSPTAAIWAETSMMGPGTLNVCITHGDRDRRAIENLLLEVARELHRRDHDGAEPPSDASLVGPYLDRLPELSAAMGVTMP